jgi:hypothetical protein
MRCRSRKGQLISPLILTTNQGEEIEGLPISVLGRSGLATFGPYDKPNFLLAALGPAKSQMASLRACCGRITFGIPLLDPFKHFYEVRQRPSPAGEHIPLHHWSTVCLSEAKLHEEPRAFIKIKTEFVNISQDRAHHVLTYTQSKASAQFIIAFAGLRFGCEKPWNAPSNVSGLLGHLLWGTLWSLRPDICA